MANLDTFNDRITRINKGSQWAPEGVVHTPVQKARRKGRNGPIARMFHTISLPMAFALGLLAMAVARYARMAVSGLPEGGQVLTSTLALDAVLGVVLAFILCQIVQMRSISQVAVAVIGTGAGALTMHMVVHRAPEIFAQFFGPAWVNAVLSTTEPNMVLYGHLLQRLPV
ncbi:hypothetical protein [Oceanicola sp. 502str15]|uniref:hypothetical protein n=1 Tax=Oceanicola sp. 502str15 TaxID=2696061 RepID=UPI0020957425|nr:hypothetical protein [Oceanicola sp. 502str15]MCO6381942.1 hypothetical protein [Oceanicola sp. 502str15]